MKNRTASGTLFLALGLIAVATVAQEISSPSETGAEAGFLFNVARPSADVAISAPVPAPALASPAGSATGNLAGSYNRASPDYPGAPMTLGAGINDPGLSTGWFSFTPADSPAGDTAFVLVNNGFRTIPIPGAVWSEAAGINLAGMVAGEYQDAGGGVHGFYWRSGMPFARQLNVPGAVGTGATDVNDAGKFVGAYWDAAGKTHGFLLSLSGYTTLDFPGALDFTSALGINNQDAIVGEYNDSAGNYHGFLYRNGVYTSVDFPLATYTSADGNNDSGQIVGAYRNVDGLYHGFVMSSSGEFSSFDVAGARSTILTGINNRGRIVGRVQDSQGEFHNLLATPTLLLPAL